RLRECSGDRKTPHSKSLQLITKVISARFRLNCLALRQTATRILFLGMSSSNLSWMPLGTLHSVERGQGLSQAFQNAKLSANILIFVAEDLLPTNSSNTVAMIQMIPCILH